MHKLVDGHLRFRRDVFPQRREAFRELASAQRPKAMVITCADSRIVPEMLTQTDPGDLFVCRDVGNMVAPYSPSVGGVSAAIEYAVLALQVPHIIILGHTDCGAMKAVLDPAGLEQMPSVALWLRHADVARQAAAADPSAAKADRLDAVTKHNVVAQLDHLRTHPSVAAGLATGRLAIHGWLYDIESGAICAFDSDHGRFVPLDGAGELPDATPRIRLRVA